MCGHARKRHCSGRLHPYSSAPPRCPEGVPSQVKAKARGSSKIPNGVAGVFRVGEVEGARHGMKAKGVVVHVHWCKGDGVGAILRSPPCGRLDGIQHLEEGLKGK